MQNKNIESPLRLLLLLILVLSTILANSIYLISFLFILVLIFIILTEKNVKYYLNFIKNRLLLLLFVFITYIMISSSIVFSFVLIWKLIIILLYIKEFSYHINFQTLSSAIKVLFKVSDKDSYTITNYIYFVSYYIESREEILNRYKGIKRILNVFSLKYNIFPRVFYASFKIKNLESNLNIKHYKNNHYNIDTKTKMLAIMFILFLVLVVIKEVIL